MKIIKKESKKKAWVKVDDNVAWLFIFTKDKTDAEMIAAGQAIKDKKDRLRFVESEIEKLKHGTTNSR